ncbi:MAG: hypothetical protein VXA12_11540, partial [Gammaproteobacteria bacterium]
LCDPGFIAITKFASRNKNMANESNTNDIETLEKEAEELRQNLWVWKGISFVLLVLYISELGGWFSP